MILEDAINFLLAIGMLGAFYLALPLLLFEVPRYTLMFFASGLVKRNAHARPVLFAAPYSIIIAGHNEADQIYDCVIGLREQSHPPSEILVVSDGSVDQMSKRMRDLQDRGYIDRAYNVDLRGGKSSALNHVQQQASHDIIVSIDADMSFDRHAMRRICEEFSDPDVGIVSGNLAASNATQNLMTVVQDIEYLIAIGLGRRASDLVGQLAISSGAFTGFRTQAIREISGHDAGVAEDLDITLRIRQRGWTSRFAPEAIGYTKVPDTLEGFINQRLRWERDAIEIRYRKNRDIINLADRRFNPREALHQVEFFFFNFVAAAATPIYLVFVWLWFEESTLVVMAAAYLLLFLHDLLAFLAAIYFNPRIDNFRVVLALPFYSLFYNLFIRSLRLYAYVEETYSRNSLRSNFVPTKVRSYLKGLK